MAIPGFRVNTGTGPTRLPPSRRPHMRVFINGRAMHDLAQPLHPTDDGTIVMALSGG